MPAPSKPAPIRQLEDSKVVPLRSSKEPRLERLKLDGQGPIWLQVRRAIARPILSGAWPPGVRVPAELDLTAHFQTSRMTVSKAIQSLAAEGLVQRRRKIGTIVADRAQERPVFEIWDTADIITRGGGVYGYRLIECSMLGDDVERRNLLHVRRQTSVLWMRCMHLRDDVPFQLEERLVNADAAPGITCQPLETIGPGPWLLGHVPWTEAEHTISACEASKQIARDLEIRPGSPCLLVERRTWNGDTPVTLARLWHAGARHKLVGRFEPRR